MPSRRHILRLASAAVALSSVTRIAAAQTYPANPINIIVPFAAGSGTDSVARVLAEPLGIALKQPVTIENKPGANGAIGAAQAARAAPDGYTLFMATDSPLSAAPILNKSMAYDPVRDFAPAIRVGSYVFVLAIDARLPIKSIPERARRSSARPASTCSICPTNRRRLLSATYSADGYP
jgi:tripartite-type tricarboxylate transporter receptor subunit TctC